MFTPQEIIGRRRELEILRDCRDSKSPEFVAVYGRRRVGKTFLIKQFFKNDFDFYMTGVFDSTSAEMLELFNEQLEKYSKRKWPKPTSWRKAFQQLEDYLSSLDKDEIVVFIDEMPWLDTPKSRFIRALELFWNSWGDSQTNLKFIVCGSATTWMTDKLLGDKGGLHNRVNRRVYLAPFNLNETEQILRSNGIVWDRHQIAECYMAVGGVPFYLSKMKKGLSLSQNIDRLFFQHEGELRHEYSVLFRSLFKDSILYREVVEMMAAKSSGFTRNEIAKGIKSSDGGTLTEVLDNLITCDFIRGYTAFGNKRKGTFYQLTDLFTLFYLKQVRPNKDTENYWTSRIDSPSHRAWAGYAFEQVCLHHVPQIKFALGISGVATTVSSWIGTEDGKRTGQIDLVIDRRDDVINLCEMKYSLNEYEITPAYLQTLLNRREHFRTKTKTRKALHLTMITVNGLAHNAQWGMIQNEITADALFGQ